MAALFSFPSCTIFGEELSGHAKGAFTGASQDRNGRIEAVVSNTVFLDEVAKLSLRVPQSGERRPSQKRVSLI